MTTRCCKSFGDDAVGGDFRALVLERSRHASNQRFVADMVKDYGNVPGGYAAGMYINGMCIEAALQKTGGKTADKAALMAALRSRLAHRHAARRLPFRPARQRRRERLHPPARAARTASSSTP